MHPDIETRGNDAHDRPANYVVHWQVPEAWDGSFPPYPLCGFGSWHLTWSKNQESVTCPDCRQALELVRRFELRPGSRIVVPVPEYYANVRTTLLRLVDLYGPSSAGLAISNNPYAYAKGRIEEAYRYWLQNHAVNKTIRVDGLVGWDWSI